MKVKELYFRAQEVLEMMEDGEIDFDEAIKLMTSEFDLSEYSITRVLEEAFTLELQ